MRGQRARRARRFGIGNAGTVAEHACERVDPDPFEPVHVTPGARRFLGRRGNTVWLWRDGDAVATALAEPPIEQRFEYVATRSGVEAYVAEELLTEVGDQITVSSSWLFGSSIHAAKPKPHRPPTVVVTPLASRLIRRHGDRIWVWSDGTFTRTSFRAPGSGNGYELVLVDGQEIYVADGVAALNAQPLVLRFWPLPPRVHAVTNESGAG